MPSTRTTTKQVEIIATKDNDGDEESLTPINVSMCLYDGSEKTIRKVSIFFEKFKFNHPKLTNFFVVLIVPRFSTSQQNKEENDAWGACKAISEETPQEN